VRCHECGRKKGPAWFLVCLRPERRGGEHVEEWLCGRPKCEASYNEEEDVVKVIEVVNGIEIREKSHDISKLQVSQLVRGQGKSIWQVERVTAAGAYVRGVSGKGVGTTSCWSASSAGHRFVTAEELQAEILAVATEKAQAEDEEVCPNCWPGETDGREELGRDPSCSDHKVEAAVVAERLAKKRKRREEETPEDVKRVLELRATGMAYHKIEKEMGWPDTKGGRPYKIVKDQEKPKERALGLRPTPRGRK